MSVGGQRQHPALWLLVRILVCYCCKTWRNAANQVFRPRSRNFFATDLLPCCGGSIYSGGFNGFPQLACPVASYSSTAPAQHCCHRQTDPMSGSVTKKGSKGTPSGLDLPHIPQLILHGTTVATKAGRPPTNDRSVTKNGSKGASR